MVIDFNKIIADLEHIYKLALAEGNLSLALRAKESVGKMQLLYKKHNANTTFSIKDLNEEQLQSIINQTNEL